MTAETSGFWADAAMAPQLSTAERELRLRFIDEYMFDRDAYHACIRIGVMQTMAIEYANKFIGEPFVQQEIARRDREMAADPKLEQEMTKRQVRAALLREAHYRGPGASHAARVGALIKLGAILGMDAPIKTQNEHLHRGGVMEVPPMANLDQWERDAMASQGKLVTDSKVS